MSFEWDTFAGDNMEWVWVETRQLTTNDFKLTVYIWPTGKDSTKKVASDGDTKIGTRNNLGAKKYGPYRAVQVGQNVAGTWGECLPGARLARDLCIKYLISSPKFILTLGSPPSRPH